VNLQWKHKAIVATAIGLASLCAGCGGINAGGSMSPATFFMPGLLKAEPKPASPDAVPHQAAVQQVAQIQVQ